MNNAPTRGGWAIRAVFLALVVAALALTSVAQNASSTSSKKTAKMPVATKAAPASSTDMGQKVFIDPVTHKPFQPSAEDVQALDNAGKKTAQVHSQPKAVIGKFGGLAVKLDDSFMMNAVAGKDADGKVTTGCLENETKAVDLVKSGKLAAPKTTAKEALDEK